MSDASSPSLDLRHGANSVPVSSAASDVDADEPVEGEVVAILLGATAMGYYLSLLLHVLGIFAAAMIFALVIDSVDQPFDETVPIRASLADQTRPEDEPVLEIVASLGDAAVSESNVQQMANHLRVIENGLVSTLPTDAMLSLASNPDDEGDGGDGFLFKLPASGLAVTKGSFTAWTVPENPTPGQNYKIIIEVLLPAKLTRYRITDLTGEVTGTDKYRQKIPFDIRVPSASFVTSTSPPTRVTRDTVVDVVKNKVQFAIDVPGAARLVKDTIEISSRRLREKQQLVLVFSGKRDQ